MNITNFDFNGNGIRAIEEDGEIYFVAKDVCDVLDYFEVQNTLDKLDDDEHLIRKIFSSGQMREMKLVTESGLYTLVVRSNKETAKEFRRWVTHEVLPSIRKTGSYTMAPEEDEDEERPLQLPRRMTEGFINTITKLYGKSEARQMFAPYLGIRLNQQQSSTQSVTIPSDETEEFVAERIIRQRGFVSTDDIYTDYAAWCAGKSYTPLAKVVFGKEFKAAAEVDSKVVKVSGVSTRGYEGIALAQI